MTPQTPRSGLAELAAAEIDADDGLVLSRMAGLYRALDPVPEGLVDRLQFGITLDALNAEIAELQRSSPLSGVRADEVNEAQTITFTSASLTTMITITPASAERARIDGWVAPGGGVSVELRLGSDVLTTTADSDGRFVFDDVARDLARFVLRQPGAGHTPVVTPTIQL